MTRNVDVQLSAEIGGRRLEFGSLLEGPARRTQGGVELRVRRGRPVEVELRRSDGAAMDVERLRFSLSVPLLNFAQVLVPDCGRFFVDKLRSMYLRSSVIQLSAPNDGMPFIAFVGQSSEVEFSFGLADNLVETTFRCSAPGISERHALRGGENVLIFEAEKPSAGWSYGRTECVRESVYLGGRKASWFGALEDFSRVVRRRMKISYPRNAAAWDPTWCTWTAWPSDEMTEEKILANAREARRLGIGTIILDDGWFGQGLDVDGGRLNLGDTEPDPAKFSDLGGLIERLHAMGLKVLLWYAPLSVSPESRAYAGLRGLFVSDGRRDLLTPNGFHNLCPQNPAARAHIAGQIRRMSTAYGADGFKTDLYNCLPVEPCRAAHEHDCDSAIVGLRRTLRVVWDALREVRPDGLLELKQNYGNVVDAQFGTMVRAGDTAYDLDTNILRCFHTQAYAPVVHNDYLAWSVHERPRDLAVMLIKQLAAGVPTFSRDLPSLPRSHRNVLAAWLGFYRDRLDLFRASRRPQDGTLAVWRIGGGKRCVLGVVAPPSAVELPRGAEEMFVLNGTGCAELPLRLASGRRLRVTTYDHRLQKLSARTRTLRSRDVLTVPPGGMAVLAAPGAS